MTFAELLPHFKCSDVLYHLGTSADVTYSISHFLASSKVFSLICLESCPLAAQSDLPSPVCACLRVRVCAAAALQIHGERPYDRRGRPGRHPARQAALGPEAQVSGRHDRLAFSTDDSISTMVLRPLPFDGRQVDYSCIEWGMPQRTCCSGCVQFC